MITGRELNPEEHIKIFRSIRFTAISSFICGIVMLALALVALTRHRQTVFDFGYVVLGLAWLAISFRSWLRARRYRSGG